MLGKLAKAFKSNKPKNAESPTVQSESFCVIVEEEKGKEEISKVDELYRNNDRETDIRKEIASGTSNQEYLNNNTPLISKSYDEVTTNTSKQEVKNTEVGTLVEIPVNRIRANPNQPRKVFNQESIETLAQTIKENGLEQPITVIRVNEPDADYELVSGERRLKAFIFLGRDKIPAIVRDGDITRAEKRTRSLIENIQRENLSITDMAESILHLKDELGSVQTVTQKIGFSERTVERYLKIAEGFSLLPFLKDIVITKKLSLNESYELSLIAERLKRLEKSRNNKERKKYRSIVKRLKGLSRQDRIREGGKDKKFSIVLTKIKACLGKEDGIPIMTSPEIKVQDRKNGKGFWSTDSEVGISLKVKRSDLSSPELKTLLVENAKTFFSEIGATYFDVRF